MLNCCWIDADIVGSAKLLRLNLPEDHNKVIGRHGDPFSQDDARHGTVGAIPGSAVHGTCIHFSVDE